MKWNCGLVENWVCSERDCIMEILTMVVAGDREKGKGEVRRRVGAERKEKRKKKKRRRDDSGGVNNNEE